MNELEKQQLYYANTSKQYDGLQASDPYDEHFVASAALRGLLQLYDIKSVLDVGCGTGRTLKYLQTHTTGMELFGIEPVQSMLNECLEKGFSDENVKLGNAKELDYADASVECVCMFGVLHHVKNPERAIAEALRVASRMVFISDHNIYGMGGYIAKRCKQLLRFMGQRKLLRLVMTRGKGYHDTDWDGIFYPFSLIDFMPQLGNGASKVISISTKTPAINLLTQASHVAICVIK